MNLGDLLTKNLAKVTKDFTREKRIAAGSGSDRVSQRTLDRWRTQEKDEQVKAAAYPLMEQAYSLASDNGRLPANARQIHYQIRPLVLATTGGKFWKNYSSFAGVLKDYMREHPDQTVDWDIVYDARGHFAEPHVRHRLGIGTLEVRRYVNDWSDELDDTLNIDIDELYPTAGPTNRYGAALFIEKEGFDSLLESAHIAQRFDVAIFSSKGQSTTATRQLVEHLSDAGVTIFVAHDFDISGLSIAHWLANSNGTYEFKTEPNVIDLGLRLDDVKRLGLQSEEVLIKHRKDPTQKFDEFDDYDGCYDVTEEEKDFLRGKGWGDWWRGNRVELNAMTSAQFITWLEGKLVEAGVEKVVPDEETLAAAWRRAKLITRAREAVETIKEEALEEETPVPPDLDQQVREILAKDPELSWDKALLLCKDGSDEDSSAASSRSRR